MVTDGDSTDWGESEEMIYKLRLFVTGASPASVRAINNLQNILEQHLKDRYELEIIDAYQQPLLVKSEDVTAVPVLIKKEPTPLRKLVGDMSDTDKVLRGLGLL
ncbi:circadian clock KaiB family protein [Mucilaginibacter agri]|uniref:Circadian clock protein KaiB n=1 Tax=Mucilaginibacter agri TaxID=2695265 RepID=A0A966DUL0_9SPHI|nr:circadian clock KaiB family protein [Mucilaginibacter agri]NCD71860.1 circadian clock protein KaiB [Mucilaginibacter agri]